MRRVHSSSSEHSIQQLAKQLNIREDEVRAPYCSLCAGEWSCMIAMTLGCRAPRPACHADADATAAPRRVTGLTVPHCGVASRCHPGPLWLCTPCAVTALQAQWLSHGTQHGCQC